MTQPTAKDANNHSKLDASRLADYRSLVARLPVTMRPSINQQLDRWELLFPFEQNQLTIFLNGLESIQPAELDKLTQPLKTLETRMGVAEWNFSQTGDTMENASMLARSAYYAEWRSEVQRVFEAINAAVRDHVQAEAKPARLILLILPESLPVDALDQWKPWSPRGQEIKIDGDARKLSELLIQGQPDLPGIASVVTRQGGAESADLWLIDAEAKLDEMLSPSERQASCSLNYATLRPFRDRFLAQVNTVTKSIEATDQTLTAMRHGDWEPWWPTELAGQTRLHTFLIDLFLSGNGALIFSNAFVEWAASEALRRARPRVIVARFGLRSKPKPFTGIAIFENQQRISALPEVDDPKGSAVDAVILARYIWLAAMRYPEQDRTYCLCVSEYRNSVYLIAPEAGSSPWSSKGTATPAEIAGWIGTQFAV
jgi:hypothetical protein